METMQFAIAADVIENTISKANTILDKYTSLSRQYSWFEDGDEDEDDSYVLDMRYKLEIAHYYHVRNTQHATRSNTQHAETRNTQQRSNTATLSNTQQHAATRSN